ncbi:MAG: DUF177 domain-containing protein [Succiniclasticum sp.]|jgi:uncharacterized protein|nr:DUF177 domain-containing protein [Succiniclasticum sp.]MEE3479740.1 DUF177 domain-containing protein [Succiniclasticum sp.]
MIKINVAEIKKQLTGEKDFRFDVGPDELDLSEQDLPVVGKVHIEGKITNAGDVLLVEASEKAAVRRTCARCLKEFTAESTAKALEKFYPEGSQSVESDAYVYEGDFVDVTELLRESLLLAEPLRVLCKEDCKGICPVCGADRNVHPCDCDTRTIDPRLSALKQFIKY